MAGGIQAVQNATKNLMGAKTITHAWIMMLSPLFQFHGNSSNFTTKAILSCLIKKNILQIHYHTLLINEHVINLYHRFRLECIITDGEDVTNFLLFGKTAENVFGSSAHHYVYDKKFIDPSVIPLAMTAKLNKNMIFQLRFGAFRSTTNICEIIITNIFDNTTNKSIHPLETPTTKVKSSTTSKTSTLLSSMKQVLIAPSTP
jgi:hypothetical protein